MADGSHILISLEPRHAEGIFSGRKQVELRRRIMHISPGTTVWIYVKMPIGSIVGHARVFKVHSSSPTALWRRYGSVSGLKRQEFFSYFGVTEHCLALELAEPTRLRNSLSLKALRKVDGKFQPPQFFARLRYEHPLHDTITSSR